MFSRNRRASYGKNRPQAGFEEGLEGLLKSDPHSPLYEPVIGRVDAEAFTRFYRSILFRKYGKDHGLSNSRKVDVRWMSLLLKEFDSVLIERSILICAERSDYPFTIKMIKDVIQEIS